jgi:hypothetical protein
VDVNVNKAGDGTESGKFTLVLGLRNSQTTDVLIRGSFEITSTRGPDVRVVGGRSAIRRTGRGPDLQSSDPVTTWDNARQMTRHWARMLRERHRDERRSYLGVSDPSSIANSSSHDLVVAGLWCPVPSTG